MTLPNPLPNIIGRGIKRVGYNKKLPLGEHNVEWDASGAYYYQLVAAEYSLVVK